MLSSVVAHVAAVSLVASAGSARADRSIEFRTTLDNGAELVLSLEDDTFAAADFDGELTFTGFILNDTGSPTDVTIKTTIGALAAGTTGHVVTVSDGASALAFAPSVQWVSMTQTAAHADGSSTTTLVYADASTSELSIEGDYADLELATAGLHNAKSLALAMGQTMTMMARNGGGLQGGNQNIPTLANCTTAARDVCGDDCVASITYTVQTDDDGNVTGSTCSFECKDPCP